MFIPGGLSMFIPAGCLMFIPGGRSMFMGAGRSMFMGEGLSMLIGVGRSIGGGGLSMSTLTSFPGSLAAAFASDRFTFARSPDHRSCERGLLASLWRCSFSTSDLRYIYRSIQSNPTFRFECSNQFYMKLGWSKMV